MLIQKGRLYRAKILFALNKDLTQELAWLNKVSLKYLKNYQIWYPIPSLFFLRDNHMLRWIGTTANNSSPQKHTFLLYPQENRISSCKCLRLTPRITTSGPIGSGSCDSSICGMSRAKSQMWMR